MPYRVALDLGTNSLGWVVYDLWADEKGRLAPRHLADGGVMIFSDGRNPKDGSSNAQARRMARGPRRNRDRRIKRRERLLQALVECGLMPEAYADRGRVFALNPYECRAKGLDHPLSRDELARALWGLNQRRGFLSNRKAASSEDGVVREGIDELANRVKQAGARTLGEYQWGLAKRYKRVKADDAHDIYPSRQMLLDELAALRECQVALGNPLVDDATYQQLCEIITHQRPLRPVDRGICAIYPNTSRAYRSYPCFQRYRILSEVNNLTLEKPDQDGAVQGHALSPEECLKLYHALLGRKTLDMDKIPALLGYGDDVRVKSWGARNKLDGDVTAARMGQKKAFGKKRWAAIPLDEQQMIVERLMDWPEASGDHEEESIESLTDWLVADYGLTTEEADFVIHMPLGDGTAAYGVRALRELYDLMKGGDCTAHDAREKITKALQKDGREEADAVGELPYYGQLLSTHVLGARGAVGRNDVERYGRIANPTVHIGLNMVRRLINRIIAKRQGEKPAEIVVELARDLKLSKKEKQLIDKRKPRQRG